jgi:hypothetical protein
MDVAKPPASDALARLASGIEAGVIGGLAMLGLLVSGSLLRGHVWWETLNLLGSTFYSSRALRTGPGMATIAGAALHFTLTGTIGGLFGLTCGTIRERRHLVPLGMLAGIVWYYAADDVLWQRVNPLVPLYMGSRYGLQPVALLSHVVFGACLGSMGRAGRVGRIERSESTEHAEPIEPTGQSHERDVSVSSDNSSEAVNNASDAVNNSSDA